MKLNIGQLYGELVLNPPVLEGGKCVPMETSKGPLVLSIFGPNEVPALPLGVASRM